jgi:uncharacterized protein (DUF433 family)
VRVKDIPDLLASGASRQDILADYPYLEDVDIAAAREYAAPHVDHPVIRPA